VRRVSVYLAFADENLTEDFVAEMGIPERRILPIAEMEHVLGDVDSNGSKSASESVHVPPRASNERGSADSRQTAQSTFIFDFFFSSFFFFLLLFFLSFFSPLPSAVIFAIGNFL